MNNLVYMGIIFLGFLIPALVGYFVWRDHAQQLKLTEKRLAKFSKITNPSKYHTQPMLIDRQRQFLNGKTLPHHDLLQLIELKVQHAGLAHIALSTLVTGALAFASLLIVSFYFALKLSWWQSIMAGLTITAGLIYFAFNFLQKRRQALLLARMPEMLDIINRSIRSGLGINRAIEVVADEITGPLRNEFKTISDHLNVGQPMQYVFAQAAAQINIDDFRFFTIAIMIQYETGGSLSDILTNLSSIIRKRHELRLKIKSLSSEARASAIIVGSLPFIASLGLSVLNPDHLRIFITTASGNKLLGVAIGMMALGVYVVRHMIQFRM